jgi:hypothetical protein
MDQDETLPKRRAAYKPLHTVSARERRRQGTLERQRTARRELTDNLRRLVVQSVGEEGELGEEEQDGMVAAEDEVSPYIGRLCSSLLGRAALRWRMWRGGLR